jgi:tetratricopeptide (TPR) repeat protein
MVARPGGLHVPVTDQRTETMFDNQSSIVMGSVAAWFAALLACGRTSAEPLNAELPNLLRHPGAHLEATTASAVDRERLAALTDDDPATAAAAHATSTTPLEVVWGFGGATVAPQRLIVRLPRDAKKGTAAVRVEVLGSLVSARAGFQLLRADPLEEVPEPQEFEFKPAGARWVMLRLFAAPGAEAAAVAEVALLGREGPPQSQYAFKQTPAAAVEVLARLKTLSSLDVRISPDEAAMFADVRDGRFTRWSYAEAALLASGVTDPTARRLYLVRIDKLAAEARAATGAGTPLQKGERLLNWLHGGPLDGGYEAEQTRLDVLLDTQRYNCVSSAVLYNVLGRRLGLDLRAVEVPDHAFSVLYDGASHADVETTTAGGFNPARDRAARDALKHKTGFTYLPDSHRDQRRETGEAGLIAVIYYNRGVALTREKRYHEALLSYFRAMHLDPEFASAVKNALAVLANWSGELAEQAKFEQGLAVLSAGLELAPGDATLSHNRKVFWSKWAESLAAAGRDGEALDVLRNAAKSIPAEAGHFVAQQSWIYLRGGEALVDKGEWDRALAAVEPGLTKLDGEPLRELEQWRRDLHLRWCRSLMDNRQFARALDVLERGAARDPHDERYPDAACYAVQQWARDAFAAAGEDQAHEVIRAQVERFAAVAKMKDVAAGHVQWVAQQLRDGGKDEEVLAAVERHADLVADAMELKELCLGSVDEAATKRRKAGDWNGAVAVYEKALMRWPGDGHLTNNLVYMVQEACESIHGRAGDAEARAFLEDAIRRFPELQDVREVAKAHVGRVAKRLMFKGKYRDALDVVQSNSPLLGDEAGASEIAVPVYDEWARCLLKKKQWREGVSVYAEGMKHFPNDEVLRNNAGVAWNQWAKVFIDQKKWDEAIKVYDEAAGVLPDNDTLKRNLEYCRAQKAM